jgi:hypothetical protein
MLVTFCHRAFTTAVPFGAPPEALSSSALTHAANAVGFGLLSAQFACAFSITRVAMSVASSTAVHHAVSAFFLAGVLLSSGIT